MDTTHDADIEAADELIHLASGIVAAYVSGNSVSIDSVPGLIRSVHATLAALGAPEAPVEAEPMRRPAVPIRRSITDEAIICLECGVQQKMLKRHLRARHGMSPTDYRNRWGLPFDYPLIAPAYSETRSRLAEQTGLGRIGAQGRAARGRKPGKVKRPVA